MKLTDEQKTIAAHCVADVVREAVSGKASPSAEELNALAVGTTKAVIASFKLINEEN